MQEAIAALLKAIVELILCILASKSGKSGK